MSDLKLSQRSKVRKVALINPASPVNDIDFDALALGVSDQLPQNVECITALPGIPGQGLRAESCLPLEERVAAIMQLLRAPDVDLLWAMRGGEGCADLVAELQNHHSELEKLPKKIIAGCSDVTALLLYFAQRYDWPSVHAAMVPKVFINQADKQANLAAAETKRFLFSGQVIAMASLKPINASACGVSKIQSCLTGGNLTMLALGLREAWEFCAANKIVMIEEVNERPYSILRQLKHLNRIGCFDGARAIVFGHLSVDPTEQDYLDKSLFAWASDLAVPVFVDGDFGHEAYNLPWSFNSESTLNNDNGKFSLQSNLLLG